MYIYKAYLFWHSILHSFWHILWYSIWDSVWHLFWHSYSNIFWHSFWHFIWHSLWPLAEVRQCPLRSGSVAEILHSLLRSGSAHWDRELAVNKEEKNEDEKREATLIKSRDPYRPGRGKDNRFLRLRPLRSAQKFFRPRQVVVAEVAHRRWRRFSIVREAFGRAGARTHGVKRTDAEALQRRGIILEASIQCNYSYKIVISIINHKYWSYVHQLTLRSSIFPGTFGANRFPRWSL